MAPEYALWGYLTYKVDVYSFGIVALEIVNCKHNMNFLPKNDCACLLDWVLQSFISCVTQDQYFCKYIFIRLLGL